MSRIPNVFLAWLLMVSIIAAAVLPPLAHAYMHQHALEDTYEQVADVADQASTWAEVATSDEHEPHHKHCSFCMKHHVSGYPAIVNTPQSRDTTRIAFVPPLYLCAHSTLFAWLIPSSRAPPSLS